jgi:hypothetical protein
MLIRRRVRDEVAAMRIENRDIIGNGTQMNTQMSHTAHMSTQMGHTGHMSHTGQGGGYIGQNKFSLPPI